jgi:hypothetical protein
MAGERDLISSAEFDRFARGLDARLDERFQAAQTHLADLRQFIADGFSGVHARQDVANGRISKNEEIATDVRLHGCAQLEVHRALLEDGGPQPPSRGPINWRDNRVKVAAGVSLSALAYAVFTAVQALASVVHHLLDAGVVK